MEGNSGNTIEPVLSVTYNLALKYFITEIIIYIFAMANTKVAYNKRKN